MAETTNPVSPKVVWAGIGSIVGPLVLTIVQALLDIASSGSVVLPEPWQADRVAQLVSMIGNTSVV